jgi:hypothetical protein
VKQPLNASTFSSFSDNRQGLQPTPVRPSNTFALSSFGDNRQGSIQQSFYSLSSIFFRSAKHVIGRHNCGRLLFIQRKSTRFALIITLFIPFQMSTANSKLFWRMIARDSMMRVSFCRNELTYFNISAILGGPLCEQMYSALSDVFGFRGFRHCQKAVVVATLLGNDCCVLMPTGYTFTY